MNFPFWHYELEENNPASHYSKQEMFYFLSFTGFAEAL